MTRTFGWPDVLFLVTGAGWTILLSAIAFCGGSVVGAVLAVGRTSRFPLARLSATAYMLLVQSTPLLIQLFVAYFGFALVGAQLPATLAAGLVMTIYSAAFLGDIWRGCLEAIPREQFIAGQGLGLTAFESTIHVIIPQAARIAIPPTVGFLVQVVKNTSVTALIGFVELARAGQLVTSATFQPGRVYVLTAILYFALCFPLSALSRRFERRLNVRRAVEWSA